MREQWEEVPLCGRSTSLRGGHHPLHFFSKQPRLNRSSRWVDMGGGRCAESNGAAASSAAGSETHQMRRSKCAGSIYEPVTKEHVDAGHIWHGGLTSSISGTWAYPTSGLHRPVEDVGEKKVARPCPMSSTGADIRSAARRRLCEGIGPRSHLVRLGRTTRRFGWEGSLGGKAGAGAIGIRHSRKGGAQHRGPAWQ